jgi:hypothetical protein
MSLDQSKPAKHQRAKDLFREADGRFEVSPATTVDLVKNNKTIKCAAAINAAASNSHDTTRCNDLVLNKNDDGDSHSNKGGTSPKIKE